MSEPLHVTIRIDQEGSRGYMWHLIYEGADKITSFYNFLRPEDAEEAAMTFLDNLERGLHLSILEKDYRPEVDEEGVPTKPHPWNYDGKYQFRPNTFHMDTSGDWGWCAFVTQNGPMAVEASTYYSENKDDIIDIWKFLTENEFQVDEILIEERPF